MEQLPDSSRREVNDTNMLRYNSQTSSASSTHLDNDVEMSRLVTPAPIEFSSPLTQLSPYSLWKRFFVSLIVFLVGWHLPKSFAPSAEAIQKRFSDDLPYKILSSGDVIWDSDLIHRLVHPPTIPSNLLITGSIWIPVLIIALMSCCCNAQFGLSINNNTAPWWKRFILHLSILLVSVGLSEVTTQLLKLYVLRRRPNFYALCQFNFETKQCDATFENVLEAQMSFPSGHSSLSFCGMTFLSLYLQDQLVPSSTKSSSSSSPSFIMLARVVSLSPYAWALFVAASRIHDFWHFASDVVAGSLLGTWASWWVWHNCTPTKE